MQTTNSPERLRNVNSRVLFRTYYEAGINWPKKFPAKKHLLGLILRVFLFCRELFGRFKLIPAS
jgi:hypothetical protein